MQLPLIGKEQQGKHTQRNQSPAGAVNPLLQKEIEQLNEIAQKKTINSNKEKDKDTQSNCFSVDYSFLDTISISDPRLQKLLNDDLLNSKNLDLEYILEQNADYFHHLFNNCACAKCTCGRCHCNYSQIKLNLKNNYQSVYKKEYFVKPDVMQQLSTPPLYEKNYENFTEAQKKNDLSFEENFTSTQRRDYVPHELPQKLIL